MSDPFIYVVTSGEYSAYGIEGVFSTKEKAQAFVDAITEAEAAGRLGLDGPRQIEEILLDAGPVERGERPWRVLMRKDGSVVEVRQYECYDNLFAPPGEVAPAGLDTVCFARDEAHAIKIANERRAMLIAMEMWPTGKTSP